MRSAPGSAKVERLTDLARRTQAQASSLALHTDHYELTMLDAALRSGVAERPAVFEAFARKLPDGRRYGVVAGQARLVEALDRFSFGDDELAFLERQRVVGPETLRWLASYRFSGSVWAYREGELYFPGSPVVRVESTFAEAVLLETLLLSVLNADTAIASAASRMVDAARGRSLLEFGGRRTHEGAAVAAARAAYVAGFDATSNLEAGRRYGIPTSGTSAHAFTMLYRDEREAFAAQVATLGVDTVLLVDTYDITQGIRNAVEIAGTDLGGVRIDSGDPVQESRRARALLDELGATKARIVVSGDLDEERIAALGDAPVDSLGVGTKLVTGSGEPTVGLVYKLVAVGRHEQATELVPVAKAGGAKATVAGRKHAWRVERDGVAVQELVTTDEGPDGPEARPLQVPLVLHGVVQEPPALAEIREHHRTVKDALPAHGRLLEPGEPALPTVRPDTNGHDTVGKENR